MTEKASEGSDRTARDAGATGCSAAAALSPARRFAGGDVGLHPFDIVEREAAHHPLPEERLDVSVDPAAVHMQRRCFNRSAFAAEDAARLGLLDIPITNLTYRHAVAGRMTFG